MQPEQKNIAEEIQKMEYEPLMSIEKKLIIWSLNLGVALLVLLYLLISSVFSPTTHSG